MIAALALASSLGLADAVPCAGVEVLLGTCVMEGRLGGDVRTPYRSADFYTV